ncbi:unnamed protein product [Prunus armeniaca]
MQERDERTFREVVKGINIVEGGGSIATRAKVQVMGQSSKGYDKTAMTAFTQS